MEAREISQDKVYCFGEFQLCTRTRELTHLDEADQIDNAVDRDVSHSGSSVILEPKALDLLIYLIENRDRVVSKPELREALWDMRPLSETVLSHCVMKARQALDDDGQRQAFIRTIRGQGYRFIAKTSTVALQVHPGNQPAPTLHTAGTQTAPGPTPESDAVAGSHAVHQQAQAPQSSPTPHLQRPPHFHAAPGREAVTQPGPAAHDVPNTRTRRIKFSFRFRETLLAAFLLLLFFALGLLTSELAHSYPG